MSITIPNKFYRVSIKGLMVRDGKLLLLEDANKLAGTGPCWELPGGSLDWGEDPIVCLRRELQEEMGLEVETLDERPLYTWSARRENFDSIELYYSLVVAYPMTLKSLDFTPSDECMSINFFSKEELQTIKLHDQLTPLKELFDPSDFS